jgi:hypothetical protein
LAKTNCVLLSKCAPMFPCFWTCYKRGEHKNSKRIELSLKWSLVWTLISPWILNFIFNCWVFLKWVNFKES